MSTGLLLALAVGSGQAEDRLRLKARPIETAAESGRLFAGYPKRRARSRSHLLLQFQGAPRREQVEELARRGAQVIGYVPDSGLVVAAEDDPPLDGLDLQWAGRLQAEDKLSPVLAETETSAFVVVFHPDVDPYEARALIREHYLNVREHPDLLANQFLVEGPMGRVARLAEWDEVAYIYAASQELMDGTRVEACAGAATVYGPVGEYVAHVGEGWDGAGRNSARLGYFFSRLPSRLPAETARAEILRAFGEWAKHAALEFVPAGDSSQPQTLNVLFASGAHGDSFPFDGPGKVLAHTYYPAPPNPESLAGDLHFDEEEIWDIGGRRDLFSVALHEAGHALGLGHSDRPGTVMYPYYHNAAALTADDIAALQELYAAREEARPPEPEPDKPTPEPAPPQQPGPADPPPAEPPGTPKPPGPPQPKAPETPPAAPLHLFVESPPDTTTAQTLSVAGTVEGGTGAVGVRWFSDRGFSGVAQGSRAWTIAAMLASGVNLVTITAMDDGGAASSRQVAILRRAENATPPAADAVAPSLVILFPGLTSYLTYSSTLSLRGTASDNVGVIEVTWSDSSGAGGRAQGARTWTTPEIPLREGANTITVRAKDAAGNIGWRTVVVTRAKRE